jgi:DNA polymerase III beta subunit
LKVFIERKFDQMQHHLLLPQNQVLDYQELSNSNETIRPVSDVFMLSAQFERDDLYFALSYLASAFSDSEFSAAQMQFLENGIVNFSAMSSFLQVHFSIKAIHSGSGTIRVSGKQLIEYVKSLPPKTISMQMDSENRVCLKCGSSSAKFHLLREAAYPVVALPPCGVELKVEASKLSQWLDSFKDFVLVEDPRFYANGSRIWIENGQLMSVTTDAHRLSRSCLSEGFEIVNNDDGKILLPKKTLDEIKKIGSMNPGEKLTLKWNQDKAVFGIEIGNYVMKSSSMVGAYPPFEAAFPSKLRVSISMSLKHLVESLKRVMLFADKFNVISLLVDGNWMNLKSATQGVKEGEEQIELSETNATAPFEIKFSCSQLLQVLNVVKGTTVSFHWDDINRPMKITFDSDKELNVFYLVVPVRM